MNEDLTRQLLRRIAALERRLGIVETSEAGAAHSHSSYLNRDGSVALTGDWDIGDGRKLSADTLAARDAAGLSLQDDGGNVGLTVLDGGQAEIHGIGRTAAISKNIGDNTATAVAQITNTGTKRDASVRLHLLLRSAVDHGYVSAAEEWIGSLRWYTTSSASASVALVARSKNTSGSGAFADFGNATVTITVTAAARTFDINVQCDHTGASGSTVHCHLLVELYSPDLQYWTIAAA